MTHEFTPTTEQVRSHYVFNQSDRWDPERGKAFDRWLAARDQDMRGSREHTGDSLCRRCKWRPAEADGVCRLCSDVREGDKQ